MPLIIDTEKEFDLEDLQYALEDSLQTDRWSDAPIQVKELFHELEWNIIDGQHTETVGFIKQALENDITAHADLGPHGHRHCRSRPALQNG